MKDKPSLIYHLAYGKNALFYSQADQVLFYLQSHKQVSSIDGFCTLGANFSDNQWRDFLIEMNYAVHINSMSLICISARGSLFISRGGYRREAIDWLLMRCFYIVGTLGSLAAFLTFALHAVL